MNLNQKPSRSVLPRIGFFALTLFLFVTPTVQALQISRVQHRQASLDANALSVDVALNQPVNPEKTLLTLTLKVNSTENKEASMLIAAYLLDRSTVRVIREKTGSAVDVYLSLAEFKNGVKVTRGMTQFSKNIYQKRIAVPRIQYQSAASMLLTTAPDFAEKDGAHLYFSSFFSDGNTLSIKRSEGKEIKQEDTGEVVEPKQTETDEEGSDQKKDVPRSPIPEATVYWQIIEFLDGVNLTQGTTKLPHYTRDTNAYLTDSKDKTGSVFVLFDWLAGTNTGAYKVLTTLRVSISDRNVLLFARPQKGQYRLQNLEIEWCAIELRSRASLVQSGTVRFDVNESEKVIPIRKALNERSIILLSPFGGDLSQQMSGAQQTANLKFTAEIVDSKELRISRGKGDSAVMPAEVSWTVIEFASLSLSQPIGEELWFVGDTQKIIWDYALDLESGGKGPQGVELVDIRLSMNSGQDEYPYLLAGSVPVTDGSYAWTIPNELDDNNVIGSKLMVKVIRQGEGERNFDVSTKPFQIKGVLKLIKPLGRETWYVGEEDHEIKWEYKGKLGVIGIYYDKESGFGADPFPPSQRIARVVPGKNGRGSFTWAPIPDMAETRVRVKIVNENDKTVYAVSENDFAILPKLRILSPVKGSDSIAAEKFVTLKWEASGTIELLNLYYRVSETDNWVRTAAKIKGGKPGPWSYRWLVPAEAVSETLQIKLEKAGSPEIFDWSPGNGQGFLSVHSWLELTQPVSEPQTWRVGEKREIGWEMGGMIQYLTFEYSVDGGQTWIKELVVRARDKKLVWNIPDAVSDKIKIRLSDLKNKETFCESERSIRIISGSDLTDTSESENSAWWIKKKDQSE